MRTSGIRRMPMLTLAPERIGDSLWIIATYVLGTPVPIRDAYPHVCDRVVRGRLTGRTLTLWRRDCARCAGGTAAHPLARCDG